MCDRSVENVCFSTITNTAASAANVGSIYNTAITGTKTGVTDTDIFGVVLYAEESGWALFEAGVVTTSSSDTEYLENYSDYAMFWYCDLRGTVDATVNQSGCCQKLKNVDRMI